MTEWIITREDGKMIDGDMEWVEMTNNAVYDNAMSSRKGAENMLAEVIGENPSAKIIPAACWQLEMDASRAKIESAMTLGGASI